MNYTTHSPGTIQRTEYDVQHLQVFISPTVWHLLDVIESYSHVMRTTPSVSIVMKGQVRQQNNTPFTWSSTGPETLNY